MFKSTVLLYRPGPGVWPEAGAATAERDASDPKAVFLFLHHVGYGQSVNTSSGKFRKGAIGYKGKLHGW